MKSLGLDLGGTDIKLVLLEEERLVATDTAPTLSEDGGPRAVLERMVELGRSAGDVDVIGVALPGLFDAAGRAVLLPNLYGNWKGEPIAGQLQVGFGKSVALINDGHAFLLAEARIGVARGSRDALGVVCGTGIGGGLMIGGLLHLGIDDRAGEVGHHTIIPDGEPCGCGNRGCLETIAGARAVARAAGKDHFAEVLAGAAVGERASLDALERAGRALGIAIANLTIFLTPEIVVVGGGVAGAGEALLAPLRKEVAIRAGQVAPLARIRIVPAELGPHAGAIGAALNAADRAPALMLTQGGTL